jgi:histone H3/H4
MLEDTTLTIIHSKRVIIQPRDTQIARKFNIYLIKYIFNYVSGL